MPPAISFNFRAASAEAVRHLEDAPRNPFTGQKREADHHQMLNSRRALPVYAHSQEILDAYHNNQVIVISAETGSGKSTQIPQLILYDEFNGGLGVVCTQPRRLAATQLATRVADEIGVTLGEEVGCHIHGDNRVNKNGKKTRLSFVTEGVLNQQLLHMKNLEQYSCIIIDEAHERSWILDIVLAVLKNKVLPRRPDLKVIIMSATIDVGTFQTYFDAPLVSIPGRNHTVDIFNVVKEGVSLIVHAASLVIHLHKTKPQPGDILVFLPGQEEIQQVSRIISSQCPDVDACPLYAGVTKLQQQRAVKSVKDCTARRVIIATNIAETSLTFDGVVYVVDSGLSKQAIFNPRLRMHQLETRLISQASAKQRAGRAGRTCSGKCYRLYTKAIYNAMTVYAEPSIRTEPLHKAILTLLAYKTKRIVDFNWLTPPDPECIFRAVQDLQDWDFITCGASDTIEMTRAGKCATVCPLDPIWYRAILMGDQYGCTKNIATIALLCSSQRSIFWSPRGFREVAYASMAAFKNPVSDHLTLLNAYNAYLQVRIIYNDAVIASNEGLDYTPEKWCAEHGLDHRALEDVFVSQLALDEWLEGVPKLEMKMRSITDFVPVLKALATAFSTHAAINISGDQYRTVHENSPALLRADSSLLEQQYEWVIYDRYQSTRKQYLLRSTAINAEWLAELPFFEEGRLPRKFHSEQFKQPNVHASLAAAKSRMSDQAGN